MIEDMTIRNLSRSGFVQSAGIGTKNYDRATDAHFRPDKLWGATGKSLIVLNPWLTLNQRVPGSSPGAPTKLFKHLAPSLNLIPTNGQRLFRRFVDSILLPTTI